MGKGVEFQIRDAEEQLRHATLGSDLTALDKLLAPDLIFTNHLGQCLGKSADLAAHASGALRISQLTPSEQQVRLVGDDVALVSVRVQVEGKYAGEPAGGDFRFTRVWARLADDNWQVVAAHAGAIV